MGCDWTSATLHDRTGDDERRGTQPSLHAEALQNEIGDDERRDREPADLRAPSKIKIYSCAECIAASSPNGFYQFGLPLGAQHRNANEYA